ncbi:MAG: hypothetical protein ABIE36_03805 [Candidatus Diapherotrites archaeon]
MISKLKVHYWNLSGYVNIKPETKKFLLEKILQQSSINAFSKRLKTSVVSLNYFLKNKDSFTRINNLLDILSKLKIFRLKIESDIIAYRDTSSKGPFFIKFPYYLSPVDVRIGGVLIGDGNISKSTNLMRWIQKDPTPLKNLIKVRLGKNEDFKIKNSQIVIPAFFGKILCYSLDLELNSLASEKFIERVIKLPKDYCLALLIALIEDEGNIDSKNYGCINIRMSSKEIITAIKKLCDSLNYKSSQIRSYYNNGYLGDNLMYKLTILSDGIKKLGYDLSKLEKKYGKEIGFWKKREQFIRRFETCTNKKAEKDRGGRKIHEKIASLFIENINLSSLQISNLLKIDYNRTYDLVKNMSKRGEIKRVEKGIYTKS